MYGPFTNEELVGKAIAGRRDEVRDRDQVRHPLGADRGQPDQPRASTARRRTCAARSRARSSASAPTASTSTTSTASTRTCRSRRPSARWPSSSRRARSCHLGLSEASAGDDAPRRTPCTRSPRCRPSTRCGRATSRTRSCRPAASSASASSPTRRSGAASSPGRFKSPDELDEDDFRRLGPRLQGENLERTWSSSRRSRSSPRRRACTPGAARARLGARPGRRRRADPGHQAPAVPRGEPRGARRRAHDEDLERIDAEVPAAAGERYDRVGMTTVNL